ncbi:aminotransferase class I/II-fold pyridoxal phosphate-dependent enzyme [Bacillus timonensis]|nr:aminotransferase class I/II-fold pyridoxal phosphate-dependent enzyme [Bacillus timonensis]
MKRQSETPLFSALLHHQKEKNISYHVPGHKNSVVFNKIGQDYYSQLLSLDVTELSGLDDLHSADGVIRDAQALTAELYNVKSSYFLVNGSTTGNLAMILAVCEENDEVLVQRNSHKSVIHGLQLAGVKPIFLRPEYDNDVKVPTGVTFETVKEALSQYKHVKALILTNPNYYGMSTNLSEIIQYMHKHDIPVLVDEAHGAHFIGEDFPTSAITHGADIVIHSAHKTLPAMTMGSFLHFNSKLVSREKVEFYLQLFQSSSPSYPIMASLDLARHFLANLQETGTKAIKQRIIDFKAELERIPQIRVVESKNRSIETDLLKLTIQTNCALTGYQLQQKLEGKGVYTELADQRNVLFVLPLSEQFFYSETVEKIRQALQEYPPLKDIEHTNSNVKREVEKVTALTVCYKDLKRYNKRVVSYDESIGKMSAETIIPYPPGIPLMMIGEIITIDHIDQLKKYQKNGTRIQRNNDLDTYSIEVYECD